MTRRACNSRRSSDSPRYWATDYDWRKVEARLNALPQFITEIDGLDIHFIHVRSKHANALPLIVTHGWPGSVIEQLKIIDPLTDPTAHGGERVRRLRSRDSVASGLRLFRQADRDRLGSGPDCARLGDADEAPRIHAIRRPGRRLGRESSEQMAMQAPRDCLGSTSTCRRTFRRTSQRRSVRRAGAVRSLARREARVRPARRLLQDGLGYAHRNGQPSADALRHRGFAGRPRGLVLDHDVRSYGSSPGVFDGEDRGPHPRRRARQHHALLADEYRASPRRASIGRTSSPSSPPRMSQLPVAVSAFPDELYQCPRSWAEQAYAEAHPLQQARQGRSLRGMGATGSLQRGASRRVQAAAFGKRIV